MRASGYIAARSLLLAGIAVTSFGLKAHADNQTPDITLPATTYTLPFGLNLGVDDFGATSLPTLQSFAGGQQDGDWVMIGGRTNGLHGFTSTSAGSFPPASQNQDIWVVDPVTKQSWSRSLVGSGLSTAVIDALTASSFESTQVGKTLYVVGGYGFDTAAGTSQTFDTLTSVDLSGLVAWVKGNPSAPAVTSIFRTIQDPSLQVTGGALSLVNNRAMLVFGQDFDGNYDPSANGNYTDQVRSFDIIDTGTALSIQNLSASPDPGDESLYRRVDDNLIEVMHNDPGSHTLSEGLVALGGVFTPTDGIWTIPVTIGADGVPHSADPSDPDTLKQAVNIYASAHEGSFSQTTGANYITLFGGISYAFYDPSTQTYLTDPELPFTNAITTVTIDRNGKFTQDLMTTQFPTLLSQGSNPGNTLLFGTGAQFFLADGIAHYDNGVIDLDSVMADATSDTVTLGYVFGGIASTVPNTSSSTDSAASNTVFTVTLTLPPLIDLNTAGTVTAGASDQARRLLIEDPGAQYVIPVGSNVIAYGGGTVQSGTLLVNGDLAAHALTIASGGLLHGTGTIDAPTTIAGTLQPGDSSIGTITINDDLTLQSGSNYAVELSPTTADKTVVTGATTIAGNLVTTFQTGMTYVLGTQYTLITSDGLLTGGFSNIFALGTPHTIAASVSYDAHDVFLTLIPASFVWSGAPGTTDWNTGANWQSGVVPDGGDAAIFDATTGPTVTISAAANAKSLQFNAAAPAYSFNIAGTSSGAASLTLATGGIVNNSAYAPTFTVSGVSGNTGTLAFYGSGNAANAVIVAGNFGTVSFNALTDAGAAASLTANSGGTVDFSATVGAAADKNVSAGSISGAGSFVLGANTLTVGALNTSTTVSGVISGTGGLTKVGSGALTLSGVNPYSGATTVNAGILDVNGAIANSTVTINNGGTLKGNGSIGGVAIANGATVAPGNSIGTLNMSNVSFAAGSAYQVEVNSAGQSDLINASGTATISGGTVQALPAAGSYAPISTYRIINATGGVSGSFAGVTSSVSTFAPSLVYSANAVDLRLLRTDVQFGIYGTTPNQIAAGGGVTAGTYTSPLYVALAGNPTPAALDSLSGEIYGTLRTALIADDRVIRTTLIGHLARSTGEGIQLWGTGFASYGGIESDANAATLHHTNAGFIGGADMMIAQDMRLGLGGAVTGDHLSVPDRASRASGSGGHVFAYAGWSQDGWALKGGGDYGWGENRITRQVGFVSEADASKENYQTSQIFGDVGYEIGSANISVQPYANIAWVQAHNGGFRETGGALSALSGGARSDAVTYSTLGIRMAPTAIALDTTTSIAPRIDLGWQHAFSTLRPGQTLTFNATGAQFTVLGLPVSSDGGVGEIGVDLILAGGAIISLDYDGVAASSAQNNTIKATLDWKF